MKLEPLRQKWIKHFEPMFGPPSARLPPLQEVNHTIPLINPNGRYATRTPRCSNTLFPQLREKTERYVKAGWWEPAHGQNASPLLAIPKICAELKLRTVIDAREHNTNTIINSTPLPNQDIIREVVAKQSETQMSKQTSEWSRMARVRIVTRTRTEVRMGSEGTDLNL
jgi:hypothetical protein